MTRGEDQGKMTLVLGVKMRKTPECQMAQSVQAKGRTLINLVEVLVGEGIRILVNWTIIIVMREKLNLVRGNLALVGTERTGETKGDLEVLEGTEMGREAVVEVAVVEEEEEVALDVDVQEESTTDTVEVTKRKL